MGSGLLVSDFKCGKTHMSISVSRHAASTTCVLRTFLFRRLCVPFQFGTVLDYPDQCADFHLWIVCAYKSPFELWSIFKLEGLVK